MSMPVISGTANLMEWDFFVVSLLFLRFSYLHFLRERLSSNLIWKNFCFNFGGRVYLIETSRKILTKKVNLTYHYVLLVCKKDKRI